MENGQTKGPSKTYGLQIDVETDDRWIIIIMGLASSVYVRSARGDPLLDDEWPIRRLFTSSPRKKEHVQRWPDNTPSTSENSEIQKLFLLLVVLQSFALYQIDN